MVVGTGAIYGYYSQRWGAPPDLQAAAKRVRELPAAIGPWQLQSEEKMADFAVQMLDCAGYVNRKYFNADTGESVHVAITVGPPGPIAVHTPEICYSARAYTFEGQRKAIEIDDPSSERNTFWNLHLRSNQPLSDGLSVYYAWNDGAGWVASESPRFEFAGSPLLYKIQLATNITSDRDSSSTDAGHRFLQALVDLEFPFAID